MQNINKKTMESQSRIFKVIVQFQEKDEVFYTRIKSNNGVRSSLLSVICSRYPSLSTLVQRCYVNGELNIEYFPSFAITAYDFDGQIV